MVQEGGSHAALHTLYLRGSQVTRCPVLPRRTRHDSQEAVAYVGVTVNEVEFHRLSLPIDDAPTGATATCLVHQMRNLGFHHVGYQLVRSGFSKVAFLTLDGSG